MFLEERPVTPYLSSDCCNISEEIQDKPSTATSSSIVTNKDTGGRKKASKKYLPRTATQIYCIIIRLKWENVICTNKDKDTVISAEGSLK